MPMDGLTKALSQQKHESFLRQLGLVNLSRLEILGSLGVNDRKTRTEIKEQEDTSRDRHSIYS